MSEVVIYEAEDHRVAVKVRLDGETVWLTQRQMAELFDTSADNVSLHLHNIFSDDELGESATTEDFSVVQTEGRRKVTRTLKHLQQEGMAHRLNPQALTALALFIAESAPANKDLMIRLIVNLLAEGQT